MLCVQCPSLVCHLCAWGVAVLQNLQDSTANYASLLHTLEMFYGHLWFYSVQLRGDRQHLAYKASKQRHPTPACKAGHAGWCLRGYGDHYCSARCTSRQCNDQQPDKCSMCRVYFTVVCQTYTGCTLIYAAVVMASVCRSLHDDVLLSNARPLTQRFLPALIACISCCHCVYQQHSCVYMEPWVGQSLSGPILVSRLIL
jgi:hypothetical protein